MQMMHQHDSEGDFYHPGNLIFIWI